MLAILEFGLFARDQPKIGLMDQRCGLEGLAGRLLGHFHSGDAAELIVNQWDELIRCVRIAVVHGVKELGDVGHGGKLCKRIALAKIEAQAILMWFLASLGCPPLRKQ